MAARSSAQASLFPGPAPDVLLSEAEARAVAAEARAAQLAEALQKLSGAVVALDPLANELDRLADPLDVRTPRASNLDDVAKEWLERFEAQPCSHGYEMCEECAAVQGFRSGWEWRHDNPPALYAGPVQVEDGPTWERLRKTAAKARAAARQVHEVSELARELRKAVPDGG